MARSIARFLEFLAGKISPKIMQVVIKWNGNKYPVDVEEQDTGITFKSKIFSMTSVPPERQKIMIKGGLLKDDSSLSFKQGQVIMMMGSVDVSEAPKEKTVFLEDLKNPSVAIGVPAGITNLGNTCYLNATMQCLRAVKELPLVLGTINADPLIKNFGSATKAFYEELKIGNTVQPLVFLQLLRQVYPQFAEQDRHGYMQQDAEECWGQIIHSFEKAKGLNIEGGIDEAKNFVDQFMTAQLISETKCDSSDETSVSIDAINKLRVSISPGVSSYLISEIEKSLTEKIEKNNSSGQLAMFTKKSLFSRLPRYLAINFIRFQWKANDKVHAKILKRVEYPFELDLFQFCTSELKGKMQVARENLINNAKVVNKSKDKAAAPPPKDKSAFDVDQIEILTNLGVDTSLALDPGCNPSGLYDLAAVLTHVGRGSNSGHYIGWVKIDSLWWKFDDDKVYQVGEEDIIKLQGGGDWHTAYICLYKAKFQTPQQEVE